jgi:hypothetical protein
MSTLIRTAAFVALLSVGLVGLDRLTPHATNVKFTAHLDGRGAENLDDIWRGVLDSPDSGVIAIRIEHTSPLHAFVFVSHDHLDRSFGAEVRGSMTDADAVHLTGTIDVGAASGAAIDVTMHRNGGASQYRGTIRMSPLLSRR